MKTYNHWLTRDMDYMAIGVPYLIKFQVISRSFWHYIQYPFCFVSGRKRRLGLSSVDVLVAVLTSF